MKKILVLALVSTMLLLFTTNAVAAVHRYSGDFAGPFSTLFLHELKFEGWYYIEKDDPAIILRNEFGKIGEDYKLIAPEYFKNDQTFLYLISDDRFYGDNNIFINGSYLFDNDIFVGLGYNRVKISDGFYYTELIISPGYRFTLPNQSGYVTASLDYASKGDWWFMDTGIIDYEVNARYYTKNCRIYGQLVVPNKDLVGEEQQPFLHVGCSFKASQNIVVGANYSKGSSEMWVYDYYYNYSRFTPDYSFYDVGITATFDKLGLELKHTNGHWASDGNQQSVTGLNVLYSITDDIRAGFETKKAENEEKPIWTAKLKYSIDPKNAIILMRQFKNESADIDAATYLRWNISLK